MTLLKQNRRHKAIEFSRLKPIKFKKKSNQVEQWYTLFLTNITICYTNYKGEVVTKISGITVTPIKKKNKCQNKITQLFQSKSYTELISDALVESRTKGAATLDFKIL